MAPFTTIFLPLLAGLLPVVLGYQDTVTLNGGCEISIGESNQALSCGGDDGNICSASVRDGSTDTLPIIVKSIGAPTCTLHSASGCFADVVCQAPATSMCLVEQKLNCVVECCTPS